MEEPATRILNLTGHEITVYSADAERVLLRLESHGRVWIRDQEDRVVDQVLGLPVRSRSAGRVDGLPDPQEAVYCLVPLVVLTHPDCAHREDLLSPDTSEAGGVRRAGQVIGTRGFVARTRDPQG